MSDGYEAATPPRHRHPGARTRALLLIGSPEIERACARALAGEPCDIHRGATLADTCALVREHQPDLILTDLGVASRRATPLCRQLRQMTNAAVVVIAPRHDVDECVGTLSAGADEYLSLPIEPVELLARIHALLRRIAPAHDEVVEVGDFRVDLLTRLVSVAGRQVCLRPKEFELLVLMLRQPGTVHDHRVILDAIWGAAMRRRTHYVRMCVAHLRRQLEPEPESPRYIVTERAIGYRIQPFGRMMAPN